MKYMCITPGTKYNRSLFIMRETWNHVYISTRGHNTTISPFYDERNLLFNICISPRDQNTTVPYL